jgi:site-specific DNA-methyltransferase (adenine-specific)
MAKLPSGCIDLIITDPPYLVNYKDRKGRGIKNDTSNNSADWLLPSFKQMYRLLKPKSFCIVFYGWNSIDKFMYAWKKAGFNIASHIVWTKSYDSGKKYLKYRHECAYLLTKGYPDVPENPLPSVMPWKYSGNGLHPTQKPVEILIPLIAKFSNIGDIVLDSFAGSGLTAVASVLTKRDFLGYELDKEYHKVAVKRLADLVNDGVIRHGK